MSWLELRQLECFLAAAKHENLRRAAAALSLSAPALSEAIARLEGQVGTDLFHRLPRGLKLTSAGLELLPRARRALQDTETIRATAAHESGRIDSRLVVGVSPGGASGGVISALGQLRRRHPQVTIRLVEVSEEATLEGVYAGSFDLGFTELPRAGDNHRGSAVDSLIVHEHLSQEVVLVLPPGQGPAHDHRVRLEDAPNLPIIQCNTALPHQRSALARWEAARALSPDPVVTSDHWHATIPLVLAGVGMAWARQSEAQEASEFGCVTLRVDPPLLVRQFVVHRDGVLSPPAKELLTIAINHVREGSLLRQAPV